MTRPIDPEFRAWTEAARSTPIEGVARRFATLARMSPVEYSGPCPDCGGENRFSINTRKNVFRCNQCGAKGDVIDLIKFVERCDYVRACEILNECPPPGGRGGTGLDAAGMAKLDEERRARKAAQDAESDKYREHERKQAFKIWKAGIPAEGTRVEDYLQLRGLTLPRFHRLAFHPNARLYIPRAGAPADLAHTGPAMVAAIAGPDGQFSGVHQTWIDLTKRDGKAEIFDPTTGEQLPSKKVRGSQQGGRIELHRVREPRRLVIGEGIETTLSVREALVYAGEPLDDCAFWSGINLGNIGGPAASTVKHPTDKHRNGHAKTVPGPEPTPLGGIPLPDTIAEVIILGDGDSEPFLTRNAVERASRRWSRPGRTIRGMFAPDGQDFNSYRRGGQ